MVQVSLQLISRKLACLDYCMRNWLFYNSASLRIQEASELPTKIRRIRTSRSLIYPPSWFIIFMILETLDVWTLCMDI